MLLLVFDFGTVHEILVLAIMSVHKVFVNKYDLTQKLHGPLNKVSDVTELFERCQRTACSYAADHKLGDARTEGDGACWYSNKINYMAQAQCVCLVYSVRYCLIVTVNGYKRLQFWF